MPVRIGLSGTDRVIELDGADVRKTLEKAFAAEDAVVWLQDPKGNQFGIPLRRIAYIEVEAEDERLAGFGR